jgi:cell division protein FtsL
MLKVDEFPATKLESIAGNAIASPDTANLLLIALVISIITAAASTVIATHVGKVVAFTNHLAHVKDLRPGWNSL